MFFDSIPFFPSLLCYFEERGGKKLPVLSSGFLLGREEGRGMASKKRGSCFSAIGESVANSYGALLDFGHSEKFLGREVGWKLDGCD